MKLLYHKIVKTAILFLEHSREGFVLDFCPTFRILSFVMSGKNLRSPFTKQPFRSFCELRSNPIYILSKAKTERLLASRLALAEREGFEPSCACAQTDFESAPLWPLRYLSIIVMHKCASQLWSLIRCGSMSLLIESTSHSQLGGRGACSPDEELANHRQRRYISPWCILYIFENIMMQQRAS